MHVPLGNNLRDPLHARICAICSIANKATNIISKPNRTAFDVSWNVDTILETVARVGVMTESIYNRAGDEVGCSRRHLAWKTTLIRKSS